jgi:hypothetical protein
MLLTAGAVPASWASPSSSLHFSWSVEEAGGRPLAGLLVHGTGNTLIPPFPTLASEADPSQLRWWWHRTLPSGVEAAFPSRVKRTKYAEVGR